MVATNQMISRELFGGSTYYRSELPFELGKILKERHFEVAGIQLRSTKKHR